jgi:hypothetical protein
MSTIAKKEIHKIMKIKKAGFYGYNSNLNTLVTAYDITQDITSRFYEVNVKVLLAGNPHDFIEYVQSYQAVQISSDMKRRQHVRL